MLCLKVVLGKGRISTMEEEGSNSFSLKGLVWNSNRIVGPTFGRKKKGKSVNFIDGASLLGCQVPLVGISFP